MDSNLYGYANACKILTAKQIMQHENLCKPPLKKHCYIKQKQICMFCSLNLFMC